MTQTERRLAAIMLADIAGYSALMERDETRTFERVRSLRETLTNPKVIEHGGRVIKTTGDGFLAEFPSVTAALKCAIDIQRQIHSQETANAEAERLHLRIGISLGDIIIDGDDVSGNGVNVAARLEPLAPNDGICISAAVREQIREDLGVIFEDLGEQQVKNIARPIRAYRINLANVPVKKPARRERRFAKRWLAAVAAIVILAAGSLLYWNSHRITSQVSTTDVPAGPLSIAVLPFTNLSGDANQAYVADGITVSLTSDLSRIRDAFIVDAKTAAAYKDKPVTVQQVGKELGVRFVLQGNVQRNGTKLRINAQLADTTTNAQLWSESFDGDQADLFALQDHVTTRIGNSIQEKMVIVAARDSETRMSSPTVADLMLRASALSLKPQSLTHYQEIEALYRQVLTLEPKNADAMASLAAFLSLQAYNFGGQLAPDVKEKKYVESRDLALQAKALDPDDPGVFVPIGLYALSHDDFRGYRLAIETILALRPKNPNSYNNMGLVFLNSGEPKRAIELLTQGINLNPKRPFEFTLYNIGRAYFMLGDNDAAIEWYLKSLEKNSAYPNTYAHLAMAYALKGDDAKVRATVSDLRQLVPNYTMPASHRPMASSPAAYKEYFEKKFLPAWRKAELPE